MIPYLIRQKVEKRFGNPIRYSKDCEALASSIYRNCKEPISITTLKRLFGFAKGTEKTRLYTLDVLAKYTGYEDWNSLELSVQEISPRSAGNSNIHELNHEVSVALTTKQIRYKEVAALCKKFGDRYEIFMFIVNMINIAAQLEDIQFLENVYNLPVIFEHKKKDIVQLQYVAQAMGMVMRNYPAIAAKLIKPLAANKNARQFFIEWFVDEDNLQGYYGLLLDAWLKQKDRDEKGYLFCCLLKYKQSQKISDNGQKYKWYKKIRLINDPGDLIEIRAARYVAVMIANNRSSETEVLFNKYLKKYIDKSPYEKIIRFVFFLCRELYAEGLNDHLIKAITTFEKHESAPHLIEMHWASKVTNGLLLYKAYMHHLTGHKKIAHEIFHRIDPVLFDVFIHYQMTNDYNAVTDLLYAKSQSYK